MYDLLDFPCDAVFAAPTCTGFKVILSRFTNSSVKPVAVNMRSAFEYCHVLEQAARGNCERSIRGDIQAATECTVAVPLLPVPGYALPNMFRPVVSHPYAISVTILGRL